MSTLVASRWAIYQTAVIAGFESHEIPEQWSAFARTFSLHDIKPSYSGSIAFFKMFLFWKLCMYILYIGVFQAIH
jgi:hypothetical protein